jgi:hypothetical protein
MNVSEVRPSIAAKMRCHKSAIANGTRLFAVSGIDGRSLTARRFRDLIQSYTNDLGGPDMISEGQLQLIRRAAALSIMSEAIEADLARDLDFDVNTYGQICDRLRRVVETLGLKRQARDVTPSLAQYYSMAPT